MSKIRSRITAWLGRRYLARTRKKGFDLAKIPFLPAQALVPLLRDRLDPVPELGKQRAEAPVAKLDLPVAKDVWLVTGYDAARAVLGNVHGFSSDFRNLVGSVGVTEDMDPGGLGFTDPPEHTRLRRLLTPEFTMRRLSRLTPRIQAIVDERLDAMAAADGPVDLWETFALPIPSLTICELLGVPYSDREEFQKHSTARFDLLGGATASLGAISEQLTYLRGVVAKQREAPGDGLLGMLITEHGDEIDDQELAELADGLLTGGLETTASMLALGALLLMDDPKSAEQVLGEPEDVNRFVEELLRYLTVVQVAFPRTAREDVEIGGVPIKAGDVVLCSLSGANRDEALAVGAETFDPTREPTSHLAFGHGIHRCIGAELARMELRAAFPALVRRFPDMRPAIDPAEVDFRKTSIVYGVESLPVLP
ncbi:cytochrome P450 [Saccharopolyspora rosea]|uniref:Cytochrome P450 n=1 Tax=Saccharopolyspora rosea TaxID=524884 RepID=A0ABW3FPU9_9PSEU|nr:cytochrome P450 [Saccharopolyspora rosea]